MAELPSIFEDLSKLTVLGAAELAKLPEKTWAVSATATVVDRTKEGESPPPPPQQTEFAVILNSASEKKITSSRRCAQSPGLV